MSVMIPPQSRILTTMPAAFVSVYSWTVFPLGSVPKSETVIPAAAGRTEELVDDAPDVTPPTTTPVTHATTTPAATRRPMRRRAADRRPLLNITPSLSIGE